MVKDSSKFSLKKYKQHNLDDGNCQDSYNKLFPLLFATFELNFLSTNISHPIIQITPNITPIIVLDVLVSSILSGIKSKHTIESISPDAND